MSNVIGGVFILIYAKQVGRTVGSAIAPQVPPSPVKESTLRFLLSVQCALLFRALIFRAYSTPKRSIWMILKSVRIIETCTLSVQMSSRKIQLCTVDRKSNIFFNFTPYFGCANAEPRFIINNSRFYEFNMNIFIKTLRLNRNLLF